MTLWYVLLIQFVLLAYAVVGGVFLAFSDFIMRSLALTTQGAGTMQVINREVFRWIFMALFMGLAPISLAMAAYGLAVVGGQVGAMIALAGLIYVVGCFAVTVFLNVPMNTALAGLSAGTDVAAHYWENTYLPRWTFWNSVRAGACVAAAGILLLAFVKNARVPVF